MSIRTNAYRVAALAALVAANASYAATVLQPTTIIYGGGATLPAIGYIGVGWLGSAPNLRLSNTLPPPAGVKTNGLAADKASLFNQYALSTKTGSYTQGVVGVSYCQTGSGAGRRILTGNISKGETSANGACGDYSGTPTGFSSPAKVTDFAASDVALNQGEITSFYTNAGASPTGNPLPGRSQVVELPVVAGAVAIVYNLPSGPKQLNLTQSDICGVFSGSITDFSALTHTPKYTPAAHPITVVYRSDGSGTTFSFTNYLSKVCGTLAAKGDAPVVGYKTTDTFNGTATSGGSQQAVPALPAGSIGQSGNGNVVGYVANNAYTIGYAEVSDAIARAKISGGSNLKTATVSYAADQASYKYTCTTTTTPACTKSTSVTVPAIVYNKFDAAKNLLAKGTTSIAVTAKGDEVLNGLDTNGPNPGRPLVQAATGLTGTPGCLAFIEPDSYAAPTPGTVAKYDGKALKDGSFLNIVDYASYPIRAVSYLMAYNGGNGTKLAAIQNLLEAPYSATILPAVKTIGKTTGYAPLSLTLTPAGGTATTGLTAGTGTVASFVSACLGS